MNQLSAEHITNSINNALAGVSKLDESVLNIKGFSTPTMRRLFNNLCDIEGFYLEVGLYCGATFCSSFNEHLFSIGIESFEQPFGVNDVKEQLEANLKQHRSKAHDVEVIYANCFDMDKSQFPKFDIYFYDGEHSRESQAKALPSMIEHMADTFVFIVDDYNWDSVKEGTEMGLNQVKSQIEIVKDWKLRGINANDDEFWHNGLYIALINKK